LEWKSIFELWTTFDKQNGRLLRASSQRMIWPARGPMRSPVNMTLPCREGCSWNTRLARCNTNGQTGSPTVALPHIEYFQPNVFSISGQCNFDFSISSPRNPNSRQVCTSRCKRAALLLSLLFCTRIGCPLKSKHRS
jgi:hypothetical protein